jgi:hypothetical protein
LFSVVILNDLCEYYDITTSLSVYIDNTIEPEVEEVNQKIHLSKGKARAIEILEPIKIDANLQAGESPSIPKSS